MRPVFQPSPEDWPYLRRLAWTIAAAAVLLIVWRAANLLILAFGSVIGAVLFRSMADLLHRAGIRNDRLAFTLGTALVLALIGLIAWLLGVQFGGEIGKIIGDLPGTLRQVEGQLGRSPIGRAVVQAANAALGGKTIADRLGTFVIGGGELLINSTVVVVGAVFIAADPRPYIAGVEMLTPPKGRAAMKRALGKAGEALRLWLKGKLITMTAMGALISAGLWLAGLKSWAALGLLGGLSEFVPFVGPTLAMVPAIGLAAAAGGEVLWRTIVAYLFVRLMELYVLTPGVNRGVVKIPPAVTLFVILGAGAVFGTYGLFFAGALLVVAFVGVRELYLRDTLGEDIEGLRTGAGD